MCCFKNADSFRVQIKNANNNIDKKKNNNKKQKNKTKPVHLIQTNYTEPTDRKMLILKSQKFCRCFNISIAIIPISCKIR